MKSDVHSHRPAHNSMLVHVSRFVDAHAIVDQQVLQVLEATRR
jgi:hypothetical protein